MPEEETIAAKTKEWFTTHPSLAEPDKKDGKGQKPPSLSQWMDLVGELDAKSPNALARRLNPTTAGGRSWKQRDAEAVLKKFQDIQRQRALHARLFVRWLRAGMRASRRDGR